jgi:hypothetical protein
MPPKFSTGKPEDHKDYYHWQDWVIVILTNTINEKCKLRNVYDLRHRYIPSKNHAPKWLKDAVYRWNKEHYCEMDLDDWLTKLFG